MAAVTTRPGLAGLRAGARGALAVQRSQRVILIADGDPMCVTLVDAGLSGLRLSNPRITAEDSEQAFALLAECVAADNAPALVLLDNQMPGGTGIEVLTWMRSQPVLAAVPVVLLTADSSRDTIRDAYAHGATSYLVKPVGFSALADVIRGLDVAWTLA